MGIWRSIVRRTALARGFPPRHALRIVTGPRELRREIEHGVIWARTPPRDIAIGPLFRLAHLRDARLLKPRCGPSLARRMRVVALACDLLDADWYAGMHGLRGRSAALRHFLTVGLEAGLAPGRGYAVRHADGRTDPGLTDWAIELFRALGLPIGPLVAPLAAPAGGADPVADPIADLSIAGTVAGPVAVVAASFGAAARMAPLPAGWDGAAAFFLITDRPDEVPAPWQPVTASFYHVDPRRRLAYYKTHLPIFFPGFDWVVWTAEGLLPAGGPQALLDGAGGHELVLRRHPARRSLREEAVTCVFERSEPPRVMRAYLASFASHPAFTAGGLFDTDVLALRPASAAVRRMCSLWWRTIANGAASDRLSLPIVLAAEPALEPRVLPAAGGAAMLSAPPRIDYWER
ncbi:hypothetical protein [Frigidibacter sp. MR17.24]|uniref:hypothetical protein n=1 Tax=Frigidibacter sp. MR17.24 TaxID=3127345 RepID=UPI003012E876